VYLILIERKEIGYPHKLETPSEISNYFCCFSYDKKYKHMNGCEVLSTSALAFVSLFPFSELQFVFDIDIDKGIRYI